MKARQLAWLSALRLLRQATSPPAGPDRPGLCLLSSANHPLPPVPLPPNSKTSPFSPLRSHPPAPAPLPLPPSLPSPSKPMTRKGGNLVTGTGWGCRSCPRSCPVFPCPRQPYLRARLSTVSLASLLLWPHFPFLGLHLALVTLQRYSPNVYKTPQAFEF